MTCQIDKDVNFVRADLIGKLPVGKPCHIPPVVAESTEVLGDAVLLLVVVIGEHIDSGTVVVHEHRGNKKRG